MRQNSIGTCHDLRIKKKLNENSSIITEADIGNPIAIKHRKEHDKK
jgi:hypothetical protein